MNIRPSYAIWLGSKQVDKFTAVEIGVREGFNAREMLKASDELDKLILVDNYIGTEEQYEKVMLENLKPHWDRCDYKHMTSLEASALIPDNSIDYCYIDGDHEYGSVLTDLQVWYPKVKKFGMLAGHDFWCKPLREAVIYFSRNKQIRTFGCVNMFEAEKIKSHEGIFMDWWGFKLE